MQSQPSLVHSLLVWDAASLSYVPYTVVSHITSRDYNLILHACIHSNTSGYHTQHCLELVGKASPNYGYKTFYHKLKCAQPHQIHKLLNMYLINGTLPKALVSIPNLILDLGGGIPKGTEIII